MNCECILDNDEYRCNITTPKTTTLHETTATYAQTVTEDTEFTTITTFTTVSTTAKISGPSNTSRTSQPSTEIVNTIPSSNFSVVETTETDATQSREAKEDDSFSSTSEISKTDLIWFDSSKESSSSTKSTTEVQLNSHNSTSATVKTTAATSKIEQTTKEIDEIFSTVPKEYSTVIPTNWTDKLATFDTTTYETSPLANDIYTTSDYDEKVSAAFNQTTQWDESTETLPDGTKTTDVIWSDDEWNVTKFIQDTTQLPDQCLNTTCQNEGKCYISEDGPKVKRILGFE